jgi:hypothetical protein
MQEYESLQATSILWVGDFPDEDMDAALKILFTLQRGID